MTTAELNKLMLTLSNMEESQLRHLNDGIIAELKQRAELSAPKAQQVGQEPAVPECVERIRTLLPRFEAGVDWTGEDAAELADAAYDAAELLTTRPAR